MNPLKLDKLLDTGLIFHIVMEVLPELFADDIQSRGRSKQDVYLKYVTKYQKEELDKLTEEQKSQALECVNFIFGSQGTLNFTLSMAIKELGKYLAVQLHLHGKFRLEQDAPIFQAMGYERTTHFKKQGLWHILKMLPLKIETKLSNNPNKIKSQEVKLGFIHDTIKNSYLLDAIQDEMSTQNGISQILASKRIIADSELVKFIADAAYYDDKLKTYLRKAIDLSKSDKSESTAIYAANCITILIAAHYSFWGQDLSQINIRGANVTNGIFSGVNFAGADLSHTILSGIQAGDATFSKTNLIGAKLGILPDLPGYTATFSPDGRYLATGSADKTVKIWDVQTYLCIATLEADQGISTNVSFCGNGRFVAAGLALAKTVKIWDVQTHKCLATLQGHTSDVRSVSFCGDGRYLASSSYDRTVKIWEVQTNKCLATLQGHTECVESVSFSNDGRYVASGSEDKTVKIWEVQTFKCLATFQGHTGMVFCVSFRGQGRYLASGSEDLTVKIWEVQTHECLVTLQGHSSYVVGLSFCGDGRYLASCSNNGEVKIWEVQTSKCLATLQRDNTGRSVSFSNDGRYVALGSNDKVVKIWEISDSPTNLIAIEGHRDTVRSVSFSNDGRFVASGAGDDTVKIWGVQTNKCLATLHGHTACVTSVSFSADGIYVASASWDKTVKIWKVDTHKWLATLQGHTENVESVSFSGNGRYLASGSVDKTIKIWEVQTRKCLYTLQHAWTVSSVSFSADGLYIASCIGDKTVIVWKVQTQKCLATLQGHTETVNSVSFSNDGRYIASGSGDNTVKIWEVQTFKCLATFQGHTSSVMSMSFCGDGRYVASGSYDNIVKIWEVQTSKCLATLQGHTNIIFSVSFSADGKYLASCSADKTVVIWAESNGYWLLAALLDDSSEPPLRMHEAIIKETAISTLNESVLEQRGALIQKNNIDNDKLVEMEHDSTFAQLTADKLNVQRLKLQIVTQKKLEQQKFVQIDSVTLLKQSEKSQKNKKEASRNERKADRVSVAILRQDDNLVELSSTMQAKSDQDEIQSVIKKQPPSPIQSGDKEMNVSSRGKTTDQQTAIVHQRQDNNLVELSSTIQAKSDQNETQVVRKTQSLPIHPGDKEMNVILPEKSTDQQMVVVHQRQNDNIVELSSTMQAKSDQNETQVVIKKQIPTPIQSGDKEMNENSPGKTTDQPTVVIHQRQDDNLVELSSTMQAKSDQMRHRLSQKNSFFQYNQ